jgi:hypothetical protein
MNGWLGATVTGQDAGGKSSLSAGGCEEFCCALAVKATKQINRAIRKTVTADPPFTSAYD